MLMSPSASSIESHGHAHNIDASGVRNGGNEGAESDAKETWKKRKKVLLAEARNQALANLQLHGLRPPPPHSASYVNSDTQSYAQAKGSAEDGDGSTSALPNGSAPLTLSASRASQQSAILRWKDPTIRADILRIIGQFLEEEGMNATRQMLDQEWNGKVREREEASVDARTLRKAILDGSWSEVDKLLDKPVVRKSNAFKYAVYKQQYLEMIEQRDYATAFTFLNERIRELEHYQPFAGEFRDLCYLLSGKSIGDAPSFRSWEGVRPAREALIAQYSTLLEQEKGEQGSDQLSSFVPPHRLKSLIHQAVAYQVEFSRYHPKNAPRIASLLYDYESFVCPNAIMSTFRGHKKNVKAIAWVGIEGRSIASGSSDGTVRIWSTNTAQQEAVLDHGSRVWDVASTESGNMVASAGGHALVKLWNVNTKACVANLGGNGGWAGLGGAMTVPTGDVYSCAFDGPGSHLLTGGYDKIVRLYDLTTNALVKTFTGHGLGISSVTFDPACRLAITASKDCSVRLWDLNSGLCVRTVYGHLGECTSVELNESGREMLTASKDNSSMLHDMRTLRPLQRFKGAQNTRANFVRASFAHNSLIASGSEDGTVLLWDQDSSECLQTLAGHGHGVVYSARWNKAQSLLASCGDDGTVRTWFWNEGGHEDQGVA
jgi:WD40 repeat protein